MTTQNWIVLGIAAFAFTFSTLFGIYAKRRPNRDKKNKGAIRQPKIVAVIGWLFTIVGVLTLLIAVPRLFNPGDGLGMMITSIFILLMGCLFVAIYKNWYIDVRPDEIINRTVFGKIKRVRFDSIRDYLLHKNGFVPMLTVRGLDGVSIAVNRAAFDVAPLLDAIEYHQKHGMWPHEVPDTVNEDTATHSQ